jgi:DNA-directed RNA polymerase subunit RPC12/RpoP
LKIKHSELCCDKPLEIKYTKSVGSAKTVENQATYFWWNMQGDTLEPSTYFCWNCKQDFEIKHLLLFGMQTKKKKKHLMIKQSTYFCWVCKKTLENQAPTFCWVCKNNTTL